MKRTLLLCMFNSVILLSMGQSKGFGLPSTEAKIFMPGIVSDGLGNRDMAISPDGKEMVYTIQHKTGLLSCLMYLTFKNGIWSNPQPISFSGIYNDLEPAFSSDGKKLFFTSNRPKTDTGKVSDYDIWCVDKADGKWGKPYNLGPIVNSSGDDYYPSVAANGNLYFTKNNGNSTTKEDIVVCRLVNGQYQAPETLPETINSAGYEFNAFVDPNEEYLIYTAYKRKDDTGGGDLYISFRKDGKWQEAKNMGPLVNTGVLDYCPYVSSDKKTLFFSSARTKIAAPFDPVIRNNLKKVLSSPGNGFDDIYYIDFAAVLKSIK